MAWRNVFICDALVFAAIPVIQIVDFWLNPIHEGLMDGAPWAGQLVVAGLCSMALWITLEPALSSQLISVYPAALRSF